MEIHSFEELHDFIQKLYHEEQYSSALNLATEHFSEFPDHAAILFYWRIALTASLGEKSKSLSLLERALGQGIWYSDALLRKSPALKALQGLSRFEKLFKKNHTLRIKEKDKTFPLITLRPEGKCQSGGENCPLLIGLHANQSTAKSALEFWRPIATSGWVVAAPQSSQAMWRGAYSWDDHQAAEGEIQKDYTSLIGQYAIDRNRVLLAGHSKGAEIAIRLALKGSIPVTGFIAFDPSGLLIDDHEELSRIFSPDLLERVKGYIICGIGNGNFSLDQMEQFVKALKNREIPCKLETISGRTNEYTPEISDAVMRAIDFVIE
jgi:predicted esterase